MTRIALLLGVIAGLSAPAWAQQDDDPLQSTRTHVRYTVKKNDTLPLIAAEYYGDRRFVIVVMSVNNIKHNESPKRGRTGDQIEKKAYVRVTVHPWGRVSIKDQDQVHVTPLSKPIEVPAGLATVTIENDFFAPVERRIDVNPNTPDDPFPLTVDLTADSVPIELEDGDAP